MDRKNEEILKQNENKASICDIMKGDTSDVIKKLESKAPILFQNYSDLYIEYLHMFDDLFDACYIAEKGFLDKLNIEQAVLEQIKKNSEVVKQAYLDNIDTATKFFDAYIKMRVSTIKSFDKCAHMMIESYCKTLSQFNGFVR